MNNNTSSSPSNLESLEARFARRVTARLSEQGDALPHDLSERLRFAREAALRRAVHAREARSSDSKPQGAVAPWWIKLASFAPLIMLLLGLGVIGELHDRSEIVAAAEVDSALLADSLPPDAYQDAGFLEYLRTAQE
jgi:hypothetical protein